MNPSQLTLRETPMVVTTDYYEVLGVASDATSDEIRRAYRLRAMRWHPDKWCEEPQADRQAARVRFEQVQEAYDLLRDATKRAELDRSLADGSVDRVAKNAQRSVPAATPTDSYAAEVARELQEALENAASATTPNRRRYWMNKAESWERTLDPIISMITNPEKSSIGASASAAESSRTRQPPRHGPDRVLVFLAIFGVIAIIGTVLVLRMTGSPH